MRFQFILFAAITTGLSVNTLAQTTPGDSLPVAPSTQPGIVIPAQPSVKLPDADPRPAQASASQADAPQANAPQANAPQALPERKGLYAPGGYGPSALLNTGHFGLKVGAQITRAPIRGVSPSSVFNDMDFHLGVIYRYRFTKFVLQPELLYQIKGGTYERPQIGRTDAIRIENNFNYLSLPLMVGYIPIEGLTIQAGPEFSWRVQTPGGPQSSTDTGITLGLHYDFLDMADKFSLNIRYVRGLTNIPETANSTLQNRAFQVSVIYNFYKK
jgi:hypothetical protein